MTSVKKYFFLLNLLLLTGVVYYSVDILYTVIVSEMAPALTTPTAVVKDLAASRPAASPYGHYQPITTRDLFNTAKTVGQNTNIDIDALKPTQLNLRLWGTVADENRKAAYAVIEDPQTRKQGLYRPGDTIQNATVKLVLREKVILRVGGKDEVLEIASAVINTGPVKAHTGRTAPGRKITLQRKMVSDAASNIGSLMNQARVEQALENGQPAGLRVTEIKPGSIFKWMGLRNGDILTTVAGTPFRSVDDVVALYGNLKTAATIEVQVKRRNRLQTITYDIK